MRITTASPAPSIPCVDIALTRNSSRTTHVSHVTHETRTPWDWIIRLPPLNTCVDAAFFASGFLLLPLLYRTFRGRRAPVGELLFGARSETGLGLWKFVWVV